MIYAVARPHARSVWRTAADEGLDESQSRPSPSPNRLSQSVSFEVHRCPYVHACSNLHTPGANSLKVGSRYSQRADRLCPQDFQFGSNNGDAGPLFFSFPLRGGGKRGRELIHSCSGEEQEEQDTKKTKKEEEEEWEGRAETERTLQAPIWLAASHLVLERTEIKATYLRYLSLKLLRTVQYSTYRHPSIRNKRN